MIERATLLADGEVIDLPHLLDMAEDVPPARMIEDGAFRVGDIVDLETLEARYLAWASEQAGGDHAWLAEQLGVSPRTLYRKLQDSRKG